MLIKEAVEIGNQGNFYTKAFENIQKRRPDCNPLVDVFVCRYFSTRDCSRILCQKLQRNRLNYLAILQKY